MSPDEENAHRAWDSGDLSSAFNLFRAGAMRGEQGCMLDLGFFYDEGLGVIRSKHEAMRWYKRAFLSRDPSAATNIAILFRERRGYRHMLRWFQVAAKLGDGDALVEVAKCYLNGQGAPKSTCRAIAYCLRAMRSPRITPAGREEARALLASL